MRLTFLVVVASMIASAAPVEAANVCVTAAGNAQDLRASNRLREARAALLVCSQRSCNAVVRADCERWRTEVEAQTPSLVVRAVDARGRDVLGAKLSIDDAASELDGRPVVVDPGQHRVRAEARSGDVAEQRVLVALGEKARLIELRFDVALEEDGRAHVVQAPLADDRATAPARARNPSPDVTPFVLGGIGAAALLVFGYFEVSGHSGYSDLENGCGLSRTCSAAQLDPVRGKFVGAGVSLAIGVVALGAAFVAYAVGKPARPGVSLADPVIRF